MELIEVNFNDEGDIIDTLSGKILKDTPAIYQYPAIGLWLPQKHHCKRGSCPTGIKNSKF